MIHKEISIPVKEITTREVLIALLTENGYEGFEEQESRLLAYIPAELFDESILFEILKPFSLSFESVDIQKTNWNREWESSFEPVVVDNFCTIRADFHRQLTATKFEIVITPKMSFGTGHHATTQIMVKIMKHLSFENAKVLDYGTGTGVLAILAELLGATSVLGIDIDEWSYENARENIDRNNCKATALKWSKLEDVDDGGFDIMLANINRHILLESMQILYDKAVSSGKVVMSGLLKDDREMICEAAQSVGFVFEKEESIENWIGLQFMKQTNPKVF